MKRFLGKMLMLSIALSFMVGCSSDDDKDYSQQKKFDIFTVQADRKTVHMEGEIKSRTLSDFKHMLEGHPDINLIKMLYVPGSNDDETNFKMGKLLRENKINTHLLGVISSGGVDFFLAGVKRTRETGLKIPVKVGVHSWSDSDGKQATDFPKNSEEHHANINYYKDLGYSDEWAKEFYFFTINAAAANKMHWMTEEELKKYKVFN